MMATHEFAVFCLALPERCHYGDIIVIDDPDLIHRLVHVLRFRIGDTCILFDKVHQYRNRFEKIEKKQVVMRFVEQVLPTLEAKVKIKAVVPLLKKEALEETIFGLTEIGVHEIQLVQSVSSRKTLLSGEYQRLMRIVIAAMEQAKHFRWPIINEKVVSFDAALTVPDGVATIGIFADQGGRALPQVVDQWLSIDTVEQVCFTVGPEAGFMTDEIRLLEQCGFRAVQLTAGVLRAQQATVLLSGFLVSYYTVNAP